MLRTLQLGDDKNAQGTLGGHVTLSPGVCTPATASKIATWMHKAPLLWGAPATAANDAPARDAKVVERVLMPPPQAATPPPQPIKPVAFPAPAAVKEAACRKSAAEQKGSAVGAGSFVLAGAYRGTPVWF